MQLLDLDYIKFVCFLSFYVLLSKIFTPFFNSGGDAAIAGAEKQGLRNRWGRGGNHAPCSKQLTLFQPGRSDYVQLFY